MKNRFKEVATGLNSLLVGMRLTLAQFFKRDVTVQYPHQSLEMPPRFRGHIELVLDEKTGRAACIACKLCEKACPSECIQVDGVKPEGGGKKVVTEYQLDFTRCSLCAACVEACKSEAIRFSREYNLAGRSKEEFRMDLLRRLEEKSRQEARQPAPAIPEEARP
jgi:NADH-quinone oxidoreductase subunit I